MLATRQVCIVIILRSQQLALDSGLDFDALIFPLACALMTCTIGAACFRDEVRRGQW